MILLNLSYVAISKQAQDWVIFINEKIFAQCWIQIHNSEFSYTNTVEKPFAVNVC